MSEIVRPGAVLNEVASGLAAFTSRMTVVPPSPPTERSMPTATPPPRSAAANSAPARSHSTCMAPGYSAGPLKRGLCRVKQRLSPLSLGDHPGSSGTPAADEQREDGSRLGDRFQVDPLVDAVESPPG